MNKKLIIAATLIPIGVAVCTAFSILGSEIALFERFPHIDDKIVIKAHRIMLKRTLQGMYAGEPETDEALDAIFLDIVREIS